MLGQLVSTCEERSFVAWNRYAISPTNDYFFYGFSIGSGIIMPATPGRYKVAVANSMEPELVESEAFVLPCSDVSDVNFEMNPPRKAPIQYSISFKTGDGGALDGNWSIIKLKFPHQFTIGNIEAKSVLVNGKNVEKDIKLETVDNYTLISLTSPVDVNSLSQVMIDFEPTADVVIDLDKGSEGVSVATSSEPQFVESSDIDLSNPLTVFEPSEELVYSTILVNVPLKGKILKKGSELMLSFPQGTVIPEKIGENNLYVNGIINGATRSADKSTISIILGSEIKDYLSIFITPQARIVNPAKGSYSLMLGIGDKAFNCGNFELTESGMFIGDIQMTTPKAGVITDLTFMFKPPSTKPLKPDDQVSFIFPEGSVMPDKDSLGLVDINGGKPKKIDSYETTLTMTLNKDINASELIPVRIFKMTNPRKNKGYFIIASISDDITSQSEPIDLEPAQYKSWIAFKDPDKPSCDDWFSQNPTITFDCLNHDATIVYWINDDATHSYIYKHPFRFFSDYIGQYKISWKSVLGDLEEPEQYYYLNFNTTEPKFYLNAPENELTYTNKTTYMISGSRRITEYKRYSDNVNYLSIDSIDVIWDKTKVNVLAMGLHPINMQDIVIKNFEQYVYLKEGENNIEVVSSNFACTSKVVKRKIICDTIPPKIIIDYPNSRTLKEGDRFEIKVESEPALKVSINGMLAKEVSVNEKKSIYKATITENSGSNSVYVEAIDKAGNKTAKTISFKALEAKRIIRMTLDSTQWTVNSEPQQSLTVAPTSTNLPKDLQGTTYMSVSPLMRHLCCSIAWEPSLKMVKIEQSRPDMPTNTIKLWIGKKIANINGKDVPLDSRGKLYPVIINAKTMLPLRFLAENLAANVDYDAKTKQITVTYPKY
jgi:hypothetical protein